MRRLSARPTLLISCGWLALVIVAMVFPELLQTEAGVWTSLGIVIAGKFAIYWVLAETMGGLAREGKGAAPAWYLTPLPNHSALLGTLLTAMAVILPPLAGLVAFLPLHTAAWLEAYFLYTPAGLTQFGCSAVSVVATTVQFISRLAHFALFAACIQLSLRRMAFAPVLPALLALMATILGFWHGGAFDSLGDLSPSVGPPWFSSAFGILEGFLCLAALLVICKWCAEAEVASRWCVVPLLVAFAIPLVISLGAICCVLEGIVLPVSYSNDAAWRAVYSVALQPLHVFYSLLFPDAAPLARQVDSYRMVGGEQLQYYSAHLSGWKGWIAYITISAASFCVLWAGCMRCLEVARNPAKRLAPAKRRNRN